MSSPRPGLVLGVLLGAVTGALALGEAHVFAVEGGPALRASLYLVLGVLLALDCWLAARPSLTDVQRQLGLRTAVVYLATLVAGIALGEASLPEPIVAAGAALLGWSGAQIVLLAGAYRRARGGRWPRSLAVVPTLLAAAILSMRGVSGAWDPFLRTPWPTALGLLLGGGAAWALLGLVRRHGPQVLAP